MALVDISFHCVSGNVSLASVADRQGIELGYLEQIFMKLKKANLIDSTRGRYGGYSLSEKQRNASVADIMAAVEDEMKFTRCDKLNGKGCIKDGAQCMTHHVWAHFEENIYNLFSSIKIADICEGKFGNTKLLESCL